MNSGATRQMRRGAVMDMWLAVGRSNRGASAASAGFEPPCRSCGMASDERPAGSSGVPSPEARRERAEDLPLGYGGRGEVDPALERRWFSAAPGGPDQRLQR